MCLFPMGGPGALLIPPNQKARRLADYLRVAIALHFLVGFFSFFATSYFDGLFDILAAAIGYCGIRNRDAHSFQQILCYSLFSGMILFWASIRFILLVAEVTEIKDSMPGWQRNILLGVVIGGPLVYLAGCTLSYLLYAELKHIVNSGLLGANDHAGYGGGGGGGGAYVAPQQAAQQQPQNLYAGGGSGSGIAVMQPGGGQSAAPARSAAAPEGFKAFSGTGHRLG